MQRRFFFLLMGIIAISNIQAQLMSNQTAFTRADTLRGSLRPERTCYDVKYYNLDVVIDTALKVIYGSNKITFLALENTKRIQIDLSLNFELIRVTENYFDQGYQREEGAAFINFNREIQKGETVTIKCEYSGRPVAAKMPPWDGGFVWRKDSQGNQWIAVACQGLGASCWWPNKDHQSDEPDSMDIAITVPDGYTCVCNGKLRAVGDIYGPLTRFEYHVSYPINNYNVTLNIAKYAHFAKKIQGIDCDFYVLPENLEKAKKQFEQVDEMMQCFQKHFGEYPFIHDGYKLVETPYLGMEHQSAVAYGNGYKMGYRGADLSGTGEGLKFDYIIIHETAHEWFGNSITSNDICDMWIHEGFAMYAESVFLECYYGKESSFKYLNGLKKGIDNDKPVIGPFGVNKEGSGDMYNKGALMLHTIRNIVNNDEKWEAVFLKYCNTFKYKNIDTKDVLNFFNQNFERDFSKVFEQYLYHITVPELQYEVKRKTMRYKWNTDVVGFDMPTKVSIADKEQWISPTTSWQEITLPVKKAKVAFFEDLFYIKVKN